MKAPPAAAAKAPPGPGYAGYADGVRDGLARVQAYVLAGPESCLGPRPADEGAARIVLPGQLGRLEPAGPWLLAAVLCPGETAHAVAEWARGRRDADERVWFFLHPKTPLEALRPWAAAGRRTGQVETVASWAQLGALLAVAIRDRAYADRADRARPR